MKKKNQPLLEENRLTNQDKKSIINHKLFFDESLDDTNTKIDTFAKYVRRQRLSKFLAHYEIYKKILNIPGSIIELGVNAGQSLFTWAKLSSILEPYNYTRKVIGFDTFKGFQKINSKDKSTKSSKNLYKGGFVYEDLENIQSGIKIYDQNRFLSHVNKVEIVKGDVNKTIKNYLIKNPHLIISLLHVDLDLYEPTKFALKSMYPLMPKGSVVILDQINQDPYPGETLAVKEILGLGSLNLKRFEWETGLSYFIK
jgi:hypothetical protein